MTKIITAIDDYVVSGLGHWCFFPTGVTLHRTSYSDIWVAHDFNINWVSVRLFPKMWPAPAVIDTPLTFLPVQPVGRLWPLPSIFHSNMFNQPFNFSALISTFCFISLVPKKTEIQRSPISCKLVSYLLLTCVACLTCMNTLSSFCIESNYGPSPTEGQIAFGVGALGYTKHLLWGIFCSGNFFTLK